MHTSKPLNPDDFELLRDWRDGDRLAGNRLCARQLPRLRRFFAARGCNSDEVDELVQQTYTRCVEALPGFRGDARFSTWLTGIAHNVLREWVRAQPGERVFVPVSEALAELDPVEALASGRDLRLLRSAMRRLSYDARRVLELSYWDQRTSAEIAVRLGIPRGTARSRLRRARLELRGVVDELLRTRSSFTDHHEPNPHS
jgi:RNA polymerase sigma factor (sigma-70 family)